MPTCIETTTANWESIGEQKRNDIISAIPEDWILKNIPSSEKEPNAKLYLDKVLPEAEQSITSLDIIELRDKIANGELSSYEVCFAFCHRAALAHQLVNCCIEIFFDKALERAKELDEILKATGKPVGRLHGVPISLKDQVNLEGFDSSIGYAALVGKPKRADDVSLLAKILYNEGAVFYVKTAVPTAMMCVETYSNINGYTTNSNNRNLSSGGSSGGEGSLIGCQGSVLGIGTDIGGSIRIPSAFNGIYGLRPSHGRIPYMKVFNSYLGQEVMPSVIGPMSVSLEGLKLFTQVVLDSKPWLWDPKSMPIPWRYDQITDQYSNKKLCFGVWKWDKLVMPHPPVLRAVDECVAALKKAGHQVVEWDPPCRKSLVDIGLEVLSADRYKEIEENCAKTGEPLFEALRNLCVDSGSKQPIEVNAWWDISERKYALQQTYSEYWNNTVNSTGTGRPVDGIIAPVWCSASYENDNSYKTPFNYTVPFNVLDFPSVVVPVLRSDKSIDLKDESYVPVDEIDTTVQEYYDAEKFDKMPVSVQVVGRRWEDEKALFMAEVLSESLSSNP
ncbi:hypothetical protein LJB42_003009 [Komagataella kurtzmanii]|nr:hypothetical protein LJB42_003009 [Komagataella kurtzmanii]